MESVSLSKLRDRLLLISCFSFAAFSPLLQLLLHRAQFPMRLRQMRLLFFKYLLLVFILFVHSSLRFLNGFYLIFKYTSWRDFSELFIVCRLPAAVWLADWLPAAVSHRYFVSRAG